MDGGSGMLVMVVMVVMDGGVRAGFGGYGGRLDLLFEGFENHGNLGLWSGVGVEGLGDRGWWGGVG